MAKLQLFDMMMQFEDGGLTEAEVVELFQHLIDTGMAWTLQGFYGRTAKALIDNGFCLPPDASRVATIH
jgi:hypothetical protein